MFRVRTCIPAITQAASIHTSAALQAVRKTGALNRKKNLHKTSQRVKKALKDKPSAILGTRPNDEEQKWKDSTLAKVLVDDDSSPTPQLKPERFIIGNVNVPEYLGFGVDTEEKKMLFDILPKLTADMALQKEMMSKQALDELLKAEQAQAIMIQQEKTQLEKANMFAKVLDLQNANAKGIAYVNRRRIIYAFSTSENPFNPGRTEVQIALLTYKIRKLWNHLLNCKRDISNRRNLRTLVHQRARILRYLKRKSRVRYEALLKKLALEPESVEGELVL